MQNQSIFERIKRINAIGQEYWSARELFTALEYLKLDKFLNVIDKGKEACKNSGQGINDHFPCVEKMVEIGSGAKRDIAKEEKIEFILKHEKEKANSQIKENHKRF